MKAKELLQTAQTSNEGHDNRKTLAVVEALVDEVAALKKKLAEKPAKPVKK